MTSSRASLSAADLSTLDHDGAIILRGVVPSGQVEALVPAFAARPAGRAGARSLAEDPQLSDLVGDGSLGRLARALLGPAARPVRLVLFDKSQDANWGVPWHQDRTIAVAACHDVPGFSAWNEKAGIVHVEPPISLLEGMLTLRLFVDDCGATNGPVEIALGTHRLGRVPAGEAAQLARAHPPFLATGARGDVLVMRLLALHASKPAVAPVHRRVVHVDYCAEPLPEPLRWALSIQRLQRNRALPPEAERIARPSSLPHLGIGVPAGNGLARDLYESLGLRPHAIELLKPLDDATG